MKVSGPNGMAIETGGDGFVTISVERYEHLRNIETDIDNIRRKLAENADKIAIEYRTHGLMCNSYNAMNFVGKDEALQKLSDELKTVYAIKDKQGQDIEIFKGEVGRLTRPESSFVERLRFLFTGLR